MEKVTAEQCKKVVIDNNMQRLGHHRCGGCGYMVGWEFKRPGNVHHSWHDALGLDGPDDVIATFNPSCNCGAGFHDGEPRPWSDFAESFNMQTPENRERMWRRFVAGKPTHESD